MPHSNSTTLTSNGQIWGCVYGDTLRIEKKSQGHFVRKHRGYGVSPETLQDAESQGATWLCLVGYDGETFQLKITDFMTYAIPDDLGSGTQLFMSVKSLRWYTNHYTTETDAPVYFEQTTTQMRLFE